MITQKIIDDIIKNNNLNVSYYIDFNNKILKLNPNKIYPIHSVSKFFTNIMLVLLYTDNIISNEEINNQIILEKNVLNKLSKNVKDRLKNVSLLQCIKHQAGLKDYLKNYYIQLIKCYNNKVTYPDPIEPEDFLIYADKTVFDKIGEYNYSNLGILLVALSLKYHYNKKNNTNLSYNDILDLYIIKKIKLNSFSITKPNKNAMYPLGNGDLTRYVNGTPASGYWLSSKDLCKFGIIIYKLFNSNDKIKKFIKNNELDIYWKNPLRLGHWGFLGTSSSVLETHINKNIIITILSNYNNDAHILMNKIRNIII